MIKFDILQERKGAPVNFIIMSLMFFMCLETALGSPNQIIAPLTETPYEPVTHPPMYRPASPTDESDFKEDLDEALNHARTALRHITQNARSTVIFDIDGTALNSKLSGTSYLLWSDEELFFYLPVPEVLAFYRELVARNFKIIFLSSRLSRSTPKCEFDDIRSATANNLHEAGYTRYERIITMSNEERQRFRPGQWKELVRTHLVEREGYDIVLALDDTPENLVGKYVGYPTLIPNWLDLQRPTNQTTLVGASCHTPCVLAGLQDAYTPAPLPGFDGLKAFAESVNRLRFAISALPMSGANCAARLTYQ